MWERRFGIAAPAAWPAAAGFTVSLVVVAVLTALGRTEQHVGLPALAIGAVVCSWTARAVAATAVGAIAWLFDNGFVVDTLGELHWHGAGDAAALVLLLTAALASARLGARLRAAGQPEPTPAASRTRQDVGSRC